MQDAVIDNPALHRFELARDGQLAHADYIVDGDVITFTHTLVPPPLEGHGVGSRLVAGALASVRARGWTVVPRCPFVAAYIQRHPEVHDLLAKGAGAG